MIGTRAPRAAGELRRALGVSGATVVGLGSILGTGVFVSIALAADIAGPWTLLAIAIAAFVAICNGLSSAQLAASLPVSGGTYVYGYEYLNPLAGFSAGWLFLLAKSASAAAAALAFAGYLAFACRVAFGLEFEGWLSVVAIGVVFGLTAVTLLGIARTAAANLFLVTITVCALVYFVFRGSIADAPATGTEAAKAISTGWREVAYATAVLFVAYTGYGRIATMGEEVREPKKTIPRAVILTLAASMLLYLGVGFVLLRADAQTAAVAEGLMAAHGERPDRALLEAAQTLNIPFYLPVLLVGAACAMLGVVLNLLLGLSRVLLAMGRRADMPRPLANINPRTGVPTLATLAVCGVVGVIILVGVVFFDGVKTAWEFSAFTVLVYYALTNWAALRLPAEHRTFPRWIPALGLVSCLSLAFAVPVPVWVAGLGVLAVGWGWFGLARAIGSRRTPRRG